MPAQAASRFLAGDAAAGALGGLASSIQDAQQPNPTYELPIRCNTRTKFLARRDTALGGWMRVDMMGVRIDNMDMEESLAEIARLIETRTPHQHVVVNVNKVVKAARDPELRHIINQCDLVNVDGMPLVWTSRLLGSRLKERVAGIDLFMRLLERAERMGYRVYFLGATDDVLEAMLAAARLAHPDLVVAGARDGYWSVEEEPHLIGAIRETRADILFLAIPSPRKEFWLRQHLSALGVPFVMGVGGSFDVLAGKTRRAPLWMQTHGLEWFFRFLQEPRRLFGRYFVEGSVFFWLLARELLGGRRRRGSKLGAAGRSG
jgi:N-acetylglucosaminyldiphosphoundecaprenol N-acetyl-beta-D-mannosaminyltransferase